MKSRDNLERFFAAAGGKGPYQFKPILTEDQYVQKDGLACPNCAKQACLEGDSIEIDAGIAWQNISCSECGAHWTDIYTLAGYDNLTNE